MTEEKMSFTLHTYGDADADIILIQMVDDHDMEIIQQETAYIRELTGGTGDSVSGQFM